VGTSSCHPQGRRGGYLLGVLIPPMRHLAAAVTIALGLAVSGCGGGTTTTYIATPSGHDHLSVDPGAEPGTSTQAEDGRWYTVYADLVEVSSWPTGTLATAEQRQAGETFAAQVRAALAPLATVEDAEAAGYLHPDAIDEFHLANDEYLNDGVQLDPARPEFLVIDPDAGIVVGAMFVWPSDEHGPQFAGPDTVWHYHDAASVGDEFRCWEGFLPAPGAYDPTTGTCRRGERSDRSPEMLHVWTTDNPGGVFGTAMPTRS
jgi:hypothetical protein